MEARIGKSFSFSASHALEHLPDGHPCKRLHGHNYTVFLELLGEVDDRGMVVDYRDLEPFKEMVGKLDHQHLNTLEILDEKTRAMPTAEHLAAFLAQQARKLWPIAKRISVSVQETPKTWATVDLFLEDRQEA